MIDWPETRLQIQRWLHQSWPFRVLAWVRARRVPETQGFGKFREGSAPPERVGSRLRAEMANRESTGEGTPSDADKELKMLDDHTQVALTRALPSLGLEPGAVGVVVHAYGNGSAYEVEFLSLDGTTIGVATVAAVDLRLSTGGRRQTQATRFRPPGLDDKEAKRK